MNQYDKKYQETTEKLIRNSYPKLKKVKIVVVLNKNAKYYLACAEIFLWGRKIRIGPRLRGASNEMITSVLAHELAHHENYNELLKKEGWIKLAWYGIMYWTNGKIRKNEEKKADLIAIKRGYGEGLAKTRNLRID